MATYPSYDDLDDLDLDALPEDVRLRLGAIDIAVKLCSTFRPRWSAEQATEEILALAEELLDYTYGGREERLAAMPYPEYLKTPEWDERRRAAYHKAGYRCQLCGARSVELHAHHRAYDHRGRPDEEHDLIVLCARCHKRTHEFIWKVN
jgi:HNH endonuclease